jgi:nucleotide-binding universal stress UspA family protein
LAAVDPLHEHARPDELDDNIVSLTKVWATSLKSSWVIVHCCYIASVLTQYKSKLITMHREGFSAFAKRNRLHNEQCVLLEGIPEDALSSYVEKHHVGILVIGLVARNTLEQFWVDSTTSALLCSPPCDLLLIKK